MTPETEVDSKEMPGELVTTPPPYHIYSKRKKWALVLLVAAAGIFSPMTANIFFSAVNAVATVSHTYRSCLPGPNRC